MWNTVYLIELQETIFALQLQGRERLQSKLCRIIYSLFDMTRLVIEKDTNLVLCVFKVS